MAKRLFLIGIDGLNRPMLHTFLKDEELPALRDLLRRGSAGEIFPCIPAYTPTNWATLCTGANTGTHGQPGWLVKMPDGKEVSSFVSVALKAETIWEVAERAGHKVCLFNYPASMPLRLKKGCAVDNSFGNKIYPQYSTEEHLSEPPEVGKELVEKFGPYIFKAKGLEEWKRKGDWIANAGRYLMEEKGYTFFYSHFHIMDALMHRHLSLADPAAPGYRKDFAAEHIEALREGYRIVDRMVSKLTHGAKEEDLIVVVSDHGNSPNFRHVDVNRFLLEKGYLFLKEEDKAALEEDEELDRDRGISLESIDWERTKAFKKPGLGFDIFVRAKGNEYERVRDSLVRDLRTWVDDETGSTVMAMVLKREDAYPIGYWGDDVGDVVAVYEKGYAWKRPAKGSLGGGTEENLGSNHGCQFPTAHTDFSSVLAYIIMAGPGIKRGYERNHERLGYIRMTDVVPTLCRFLGFEAPAQSQGAIIQDFIDGQGMDYQRPARSPEL